MLTLKQVASQMIHTIPTYADMTEPPKLYVTDELVRQKLVCERATTVYVSAHNPGARKLIEEDIRPLQGAHTMDMRTSEIHTKQSKFASARNAKHTELRREASRLSGEMTASGEMTRPSPETSFTSVDPS